jgi:hypothetical protein
MYLAKFDTNGNRITSIAEGIHFETEEDKQTYITDGFIEISDDDQQLYVTNEYIRGTDGVPQKKPEYIPTTEEKLAALDAEYQPQFAELAQNMGVATLDGNQVAITGIKEDYATLKAEYTAKMEALG